MTARLARLAAGLTGATLTVLLLVAPPWLLTTLVGPPIPRSWPDLDTLHAIAEVGVTDSFVVTTLAVIVWIAWIQLTAAIAFEAIAALRRRPPIRLPLVPGTQPLAARLVAATLLLVTALHPRPVTADTPLQLAVVTAAAASTEGAPQAAAVPATPTRDVPPADTATVTAGERDSWWSLAETHLGDGARWRELRDLNLDRRLRDGTVIRADTDRLEPGWELLVPAQDGHAVQTDRGAPSPADTAAVWEVEPGEHFWGASADTLEQAWGRSPTDEEVAPYWQQLVEGNRERLAPPHDPDLIYPGQRFVLPDPPPDPTATELVPPDTETEAGPAATPTPSAPEAADPPADPAGPAGRSEAAGRNVTGGRLPDHLDRSGAPPHTAPTDGEQSADAATGRTSLGIPTGLSAGTAAAALAAAGIVALLGRRRRAALQQRTPSLRLPTPAPAFVDHLGSLTAAAPPDKVLDDLVDLLSTIPETAAPTLVLIHDSGPISLVFERPDTEPPPSPWQVDSDHGGPPRWTARLGTRGPRRSIGLPLLLTLGRTDAATVLANLGAIGTLPVTGPPGQVTDRLRTAGLELACSRTAGPIEVTVVGDPDVPEVEQLRRGEDPARAVAAALDDANQGIVADDRLPRVIICHDPARQLDLPSEVTGYCAQLTASTGTPGGWHLEVDDTRTWLHLPDGDRHELTSPDIQPGLINDELDRLRADNNTPDRPESTGPAPAGDPGPVTTPNPDPVTTPDAEPEREPWCEVALLGPLQVTCDGQPLGSLTPTVRQLLPYLATHRHGVTLDRLDDTIWPGRAPSRHGQRARTALTRLRQALGDGPDGQPLIARRDHGDQPVTISEHITTDIDRALHHLEIAKTCHGDDRIDRLQTALDLIRGEPFQDVAHPWTLDIQQHAITHLHDAALTAAALLRQAGRYEDAEHAIRQGLALYDPSEPLYVEWAHLEHARGRTDRIPQLQRRLQQRYADQADETAGTITTPTIETELAFTTLTQGRPD